MNSVIITRWICMAVILINIEWSTSTAIYAPDASLKTICDARLFRQTVVNVCTFHRRDVSRPIADTPNRYFYNVNGRESETDSKRPRGERENYGKLVFTQLGEETFFSPVLEQPKFSSKVKRHREFVLHQKCCRNGCSAMDFASVC